MKLPGRVGDVPCIGAGLYADDALGAATSSGEGEQIMRVVMAKWAVDQLAGGVIPARIAARRSNTYIPGSRGRSGLILIDRLGRVGCWFNTRRMSRAWSVGSNVSGLIEPAL